MVNVPMRSGRTTAWPKRHVARDALRHTIEVTNR